MRTPAKVLAPADVRRLRARAKRGRHRFRNEAIVLLSFHAGLRACEIAGLDWNMVLTARGRVGWTIHVGGDIAKNGSPRELPVHPALRATLGELHGQYGRPRCGPVIASQKGGHMTPRSVVNWFAHEFAKLGLKGCSSHSGRRTFITRSAKLIAKAGGSLRDVQILVGHKDLATTQRYIDGDTQAQRKLIAML